MKAAIVLLRQQRRRRCYLTSCLVLLPQLTSGFSVVATASRTTTATARHLSSDDDVNNKWERMYQLGEISSAMAKADLNSAMNTLDDGASSFVEATSTSSTDVRVVSFDLDNTLWKTGPTIQAANDALAAYLDEREILQPQRVEKVMGQLFSEHKSKYAPLSEEPQAPVLLTQLRRDAVISMLIDEPNDFTQVDAEAFAKKAFTLWTQARHAALSQHYAVGVVDCLQKIRSLTPSVVIGAITDGNSDPRTVPVLKDYFDFCVNAEQVGISKPDRRVYMKAVQQVASQDDRVRDLFNNVDDMNDLDALEDALGPWWVHVGDDFLKDIVAAKELNMRSIWARELVPPDLPPPAPKKPTKSVEQFVQEISNKLADKAVVEMQLGSDDFLAGSIQEEFADATVDTFEQVGATIAKWHAAASNKKDEAVAVEEEAAESQEILTVVYPDNVGKEDNSPEASTDNKFCMNCGTKLPVTAKFCSSCGEKLPELT